ncbi:uncharacterized protein HKW66_Vig0075830 [Vigna angularis]|uniref:Uncharacterized protein n=1 Tax=Phaseolus angularis TaxID=3914 RepID=A0A8T0K5Z8_PHAAN|nr:uncharacterized protein HKW66_Vig0075830 [Vigna angularis]
MRERIGRVVNVFVRVREGKTIEDLTSTQIWQNSKSTVSKTKNETKGGSVPVPECRRRFRGVVSVQFRLLLSCGMGSFVDHCPTTKDRTERSIKDFPKAKESNLSLPTPNHHFTHKTLYSSTSASPKNTNLSNIISSMFLYPWNSNDNLRLTLSHSTV